MYKKEHMVRRFCRKKMDVNCLSPYFPWHLRCIFKDNCNSFNAKDRHLLGNSGAVIIIAGARSDNEFESQIMGGSDEVYHTLINHLGFPTDRVYFLGEYGYGADADLKWHLNIG